MRARRITLQAGVIFNIDTLLTVDYNGNRQTNKERSKMIYFRVEIYDARRDERWVMHDQVISIPLFQTDDYRRSSLIDSFAHARLLASRNRPPQKGEMAFIRASYIGTREGGLPYAERMMEYTGLDMLAGEHEQEPELWKTARRLAANPDNLTEARGMFSRVAKRYEFDCWDSVVCALQAGMTVKAQSMYYGDEAEVKLGVDGSMYYLTPEGHQLHILQQKWPVHHLYIESGR